MLRKLKWQLPGEPLAPQNNWYQGPVPGRGPEVEKHWCRVSLDKSVDTPPGALWNVPRTA